MRITRSIIPNLFTLANAFMGFTAIVHISHNDFWMGAVFILAAGVFDMLDGLVARLTKSASEFGAMLDSMCDAVSFGVAPSFMLYVVFFASIGEMGILLASLPALAGVIRLARFNVQMNGFEDKYYFTGMPIPGGAITIVSYVIFFHIPGLIPIEYVPFSITAVSVIASLAMVSRVKFDNIPRFTLRYIKQKPIVFTVFIAGVIGSVVSKGVFLFPFMAFYIAASSVRHFFKWLKEYREATDEIDESDIEEPGHYF